jgi:hypothetical protein
MHESTNVPALGFHPTPMTSPLQARSYRQLTTHLHAHLSRKNSAQITAFAITTCGFTERHCQQQEDCRWQVLFHGP